MQSAKQLVGLMFRIQNEPGQYKFDIKYFGTKADGAPEEENPASTSAVGTNAAPGEFVLNGYDGVLWTPTKDAARVKTSSFSENLWPENAVEDGRWYWSTDEEAGGRSSVRWPVALGAENSLTPVVESCKGVCGVASLKKELAKRIRMCHSALESLKMVKEKRYLLTYRIGMRSALNIIQNYP